MANLSRSYGIGLMVGSGRVAINGGIYLTWSRDHANKSPSSVWIIRVNTLFPTAGLGLSEDSVKDKDYVGS